MNSQQTHNSAWFYHELSKNSSKNPLDTVWLHHWVFCERNLRFLSQSGQWVLCWALFESTHHLLKGYVMGTLIGIWSLPQCVHQLGAPPKQLYTSGARYRGGVPWYGPGPLLPDLNPWWRRLPWEFKRPLERHKRRGPIGEAHRKLGGLDIQRHWVGLEVSSSLPLQARVITEYKSALQSKTGTLMLKRSHSPLWCVRNMGNFNLFQTHVLTFFHHVEQCCYPSFLTLPHIPAMTSHVAYVIYATFTLITTQGLVTLHFSYVFLSFYAFGTVLFLMFFTFFLSFSHIHVAFVRASPP